MLSICTYSNVTAQQLPVSIDSILKLRALANNSASLEDRLSYAIQASELSNASNQDSTILNSNRILAYSYLINGAYDAFANTTRDNLDKALKLKDSAAIAFSSKNLGWYNYNIENDNLNSYDYYLTSLKYFEALNNAHEKAVALYCIASIQDDEKDYLGSEKNAIEALNILRTLKSQGDKTIYRDEYICLNLLGIVSLKLENYTESLNYHEQAYALTDHLDDREILKLQSKNNLAISHRAIGDFEKTLTIYDHMLEESETLLEDPSFYALVLINQNTTRFMTGDYDYQQLEREFQKAYKISDSIDDKYTKLSASIDMAKFYLDNHKDTLARRYANESYGLAKDIPINELYMESMLILAELTEGKTSRTYLEEHIQLSDSLLKVERSVRNKFARIRYETDIVAAENQRISQQRMWLAIVSVVLVLALFLLYIVITQRNKNKVLEFEKSQQQANEDIYNLMLSQQDKVDEARANEKKRISQDMHDGILGRLFGTRLSLDSLNFSEGKDAILSRANYINELKGIEEDIRKISHDLNSDFVSGSNFMTIVAELIEKQTKAYQLGSKFDYTDDIDWEGITNKTKINLYRIIQESLQNIYKHADAKIVHIQISSEQDTICLDIIDDGKGFDVNKSKKGIGLKNINSRISELNGKVRFHSKPNQGTRLEITIPNKT